MTGPGLVIAEAGFQGRWASSFPASGRGLPPRSLRLALASNLHLDGTPSSARMGQRSTQLATESSSTPPLQQLVEVRAGQTAQCLLRLRCEGGDPMRYVCLWVLATAVQSGHGRCPDVATSYCRELLFNLTLNTLSV